jgi:hypothetical protein
VNRFVHGHVALAARNRRIAGGPSLLYLPFASLRLIKGEAGILKGPLRLIWVSGLG